MKGQEFVGSADRRVRRAAGQLRYVDHRRHRLLGQAGVHHQAWAQVRLVLGLAFQHPHPVRDAVVVAGGVPGLDPAAVLGVVAADHLDHPQRHVEPLGQLDPELAGRLHRVDRVDDHVVADPQLHLGQRRHHPVRGVAGPGLGDVVALQREVDRVDRRAPRPAARRPPARPACSCRPRAGRRRRPGPSQAGQVRLDLGGGLVAVRVGEPLGEDVGASPRTPAGRPSPAPARRPASRPGRPAPGRGPS